LGFYDDIVDIDLQVTPHLPLEVELHTPLICGPFVLQSERQFYIAKTALGGDERGGGLILLGEGYLVVT
jgi:hypothetical protein